MIARVKSNGGVEFCAPIEAVSRFDRQKKLSKLLHGIADLKVVYPDTPKEIAFPLEEQLPCIAGSPAYPVMVLDQPQIVANPQLQIAQAVEPVPATVVSMTGSATVPIDTLGQALMDVDFTQSDLNLLENILKNVDENQLL